MKNKFITVKSEDYSLMDNHTGEILDYNQVKKVNIDDFIMIYLSSIPETMALSGQVLKVFMCCWKLSSFNPSDSEEGNVIVNNKSFKRRIRECGLDISDQGIDNAISALYKKNFLLKLCKGEYMLNPKYCFKGTLSQRSKLCLNVLVEPRNKEGEELMDKLNTCFLIKSVSVDFNKEDYGTGENS